MNTPALRWMQRFQNYQRALARLTEAVELSRQRSLTDLEQQGLVQAFEFTHELAWNSLKDFLESRGAMNLYGSRDATRAAFAAGLISDGDVWMDMIRHRNQTTHTYNEETVREIVTAITSAYIGEFGKLRDRLQQLEREGGTA